MITECPAMAREFRKGFTDQDGVTEILSLELRQPTLQMHVALELLVVHQFHRILRKRTRRLPEASIE